MSNTVVLRSIINQYFTEDVFVDLYKVTLAYKLNNNQRGLLVKEIMKKYNIPASPLGNGTNRIGLLVDGYAVKIALDDDGMIDNRREMLYSKDLYPDVIKMYECTPNGLISVSEYVNTFTLDDYRERQDDMREILERVSSNFLIGDVGINSKNYINWGTREDGSICMLDYAYCYALRYKFFTCSCDGASMLLYDNDYVGLRCPRCGKKYTFWDIRKKVTRQRQEEEIGDIRRLGYLLYKSEEEVEKNAAFEPEVRVKKKENPAKTYLKAAKERERAYKKLLKEQTDI